MRFLSRFFNFEKKTHDDITDKPKKLVSITKYQNNYFGINYDDEDMALVISGKGCPPVEAYSVVFDATHKLLISNIQGYHVYAPPGYARGNHVFFFRYKEDYENFKERFPRLQSFNYRYW